ncbi:hypothetical protein E1B28_006744 [Marasmius oreades]|uniref:Uncharacterized protein n=1 Tax=Marasmius oreades TaxID=181124 RepID=A0A9P7UWS9_9AGAR|nr:uncharacterized protein E1B28_006744 [Marasmius oreades]KAG7096063.1 hypothetical protein E1B28_006744 [Marasmius oreades]
MSPIPSSHVTKTAGPFLLGYFLNYGLYGVLTVQTYIYYNAFPNDRIRIQIVVYGLYIVETMQTVIITWDAFQNFVFGFGEPGVINFKRNLTWLDVCLVDGLVAFVVQTFFAHRIYVLSKSKLITAAIMLFALAQLGGALKTTQVAIVINSITESQAKNAVGVSVRSISILFAPVEISLKLLILVLARRKRSMRYYHSSFDDLHCTFAIPMFPFRVFKGPFDPFPILIVHRVVVVQIWHDNSKHEKYSEAYHSIDYGDWEFDRRVTSATVATVDLILFQVFPDLPYHMAPALILAKLYSNSMMVILNSRVKIVGGRGQESSMAGGEGIITLNGLGLDSLSGLGRRTETTFDLQTHRSQLSVGIKRETEVDAGNDQTRSQKSHVDHLPVEVEVNPTPVTARH